jgi:hypothetical protein
MKLKKLTAALLGALLILSLVAGCTGKTVSPFVSASPSASASTSDAADATSADTLNIAGAYASLSPDTVMLTIDGNDITWDELFYMINYAIDNYRSQTGEITDWSASFSDIVTIASYVLDTAVSFVLQDAAIEYGASHLEVTLCDDAQANIQSDWDDQVASAGSEEEFVAMLEAQYCTKEIYQKLVTISQMAQACFDEIYGENGAKLTDEQAADYTAEDGYLMAKHILMLTTKTDDSGTETDMTDEEKAQVYAKMQDILEQLNSYEGDDF